MDYRDLNVNPECVYDEEDDDTVTESTVKIIRNPGGFYFDIVLDVMESHVKQNVDI